MTDKQINVAIAAYLGITRGVPDFTGDLNEMHQAEKSLTGKLFEDYLIELLDFIDEPILATARQRAEAFLRMLGKWEEVQG